MTGKEDDRFSFAQSGKEKTAGSLLVGRLAIELPVKIKERGDLAHVSRRSL